MVLSQAETILAEFPVYPGQPATWADYLAWRDSPGETLCERETTERLRLFFQQGWLWVEMGAEGVNHASVSDLFTMFFFVWSTLHPEQTWTSLGRCLLEKAPLQAGVPDLVLYQGAAYPRWQPGEPRRIDLHQWSAPLLVGEIVDTTLKADLEDKQQIYHAMGIAEYWVIDVQGERVLGFQWQPTGYVEIAASQMLSGVSFGLLNQALQRLQIEPNTRVAAWLATELQP